MTLPGLTRFHRSCHRDTGERYLSMVSVQFLFRNHRLAKSAKAKTIKDKSMIIPFLVLITELFC